ncbi:MAG: histidine--tRNA ligase [Planctomycetes bacterium]|nr:histidine--tRNA ligase [Planctomycetota bacterium]
MPRTHTFQAPKGTRDFLPADLAVRRHVENAWRAVSVNHGFDEIDGPTFEHLDLYTVKSGEGIVSELFSFRRAGGDVDYALRPEFTPTLARMYASAARTLPKPTRWFCIPSFFRAERPQRGRLREFFQWNADVIGDETARADAEVIAVTVGVLQRLGLGPDAIRVKVNHRSEVEEALDHLAVPEEQRPEAYRLLDARAKLNPDKFRARAAEIGIPDIDGLLGWIDARADVPDRCRPLWDALAERDLLDWCDFQRSIVRGIAYYTGLVFEVHETSGKERAVAGGGRYDTLVEMFGGPPTPAVGIAMGDVVLRLVLEDHGLLGDAATYLPAPAVFVISGIKEGADPVPRIVAELRSHGLHVRASDRASRNIGKQLGEAGKARARLAVILGDELTAGKATVKDLASGEQSEVALDALAEHVAAALSK